MLVNDSPSGFYLSGIVQRAKKCLDFTVTTFGVHFLLSAVIRGFPLSVDWWAAMVVCFIAMGGLGEWLCMRHEMREIPRGSLASESV